LYRSAIPVVLLAVALSGAMYELQEQLVPESHRQAEALRHVMRGLPAETFGTLERKWIVGHEGDIYHYENFDPRIDRFNRLTVYDLDPKTWRLASLTYAKEVGLVGNPARTTSGRWAGRDEGWTRTFSTAGGAAS
jgi:lipopolysaccharide export LptBFGC system permease protein LptF